jgi:hypothetical protein
MMTGEEFGFALLAAIQGKGHAVLKPMESVIREALGVEEVIVSAPAPIPQVWKPDFPQTRTNYSASGEMLDSRFFNTIEEFRLALQEEPLLAGWFVSR